MSERKRSQTYDANARGEKAISLTKTGSSSKDSSRPTSAQSRSAALYGATECFALATKPSTSISGETSDAEELSTDMQKYRLESEVRKDEEVDPKTRRHPAGVQNERS